MAEDSFRRKTRSASICAPGFSSMEQMLEAMPPSGARERERGERERDSGSGTPDGSTPTRKRRPATRSQSARVSGGNKSIRRRAAAQAAAHHHHHHEGASMKSAHCSSEPKLTENDVSPGIRRRGSRRGQSMHYSHQRKSNAFLDVPDVSSQMPPREEGEDEDSYRLRSFSLTSKGVVNRGDSFRRRRSRSNSLAPADQQNEERRLPPKEVASHNVAMLGTRGVGKTALISQFMTSECINAYDRQRDVPSEQSVFVMLNGEESELKFLNIINLKIELEKMPLPDAFVVMYSVIDKASFQRAEEYLARLHDQDLLRGRPAILVGNKVDLVRSRVVSPQDGKCLACTYRAKFIEVSVGINHNVDELLVGILNQIRLKVVQSNQENRNSGGSEGSAHWYKSRGVVRASMKARQMLTWLFGKEDSKFKNCENLHVLFFTNVEKTYYCDTTMASGKSTMASAKPTTCKEAIRRWEEENQQNATAATEVILSFQWPPIEKMDNALATLANCEKLSLSTNMIEKIAGVGTLKNLKILSIGRNLIKGFAGLEPLGDTLEELWISYNCIEKMKGIQAMRNLHVLYMSNNLVREWNEFARLQELGNLRDLVFVGNPLYENLEVEQWRLEVARRLSSLEKLDGEPIIRTEENSIQLVKTDSPSHDLLDQ
ncbi:PREDICTED: uncharacterized protein LOC108766731 isoform X2 [Trachymyrmex cornetzi]|uniref:uncharacterized protein LOC108766731 isoform X2 n=1 Tax=Trachymyrmex cornetzi TaxID=471704 RepID=UPI00084F3002|nr:PREDICTED: uncharacterized protein LOC108766731 isoform X2 [Trachymyrmex cornetzi]